LNRDEVFARDGYRCVYCGQLFEPALLTVDHVQPRVRGGDRSGGNLVTACGGCNTLKGHRRLAEFLLENAAARASFHEHARHVWPRHLRALEEEMERGGLAKRRDAP
jgi:5-methylcytosine-specific restriction endonuclease McrA